MMAKYSLLIATLNRPEQLNICVDHIINQTYQDYEVIIIDQSDNGKTCEYISELSNAIKYIHISEKGLSHARNIGLKYVTGDFVCLVDDDGLYEPNTLEQANKVVQKYNPTVLGGTIEDPVTGIKRGIDSNLKVGWKSIFKYHQSPSMIIESGFIKERMFDEAFGIGAKYGSGEESDIVIAALSCGKDVYFSNEYKVIHPVEGLDLSKLSERKIKNYAFGYGALCKKMFKKYSKFWGCYYLIKTVTGNFIYSVLYQLKGEKTLSKLRKYRAAETLRGYFDYK